MIELIKFFQSMMATLSILLDFIPYLYSYFNPTEECSICFCTVPLKEYTPLDCGHQIHHSCLMRWKNSCPLCRLGKSEDETIQIKFNIKADLKEIKNTLNKW